MTAFLVPTGWQWIIILLIILLLFGHRLPGLARALGSGITEFRKGLKEGGDDKEKLPPPPPGTPEKRENQATS
jgi:sec-independent protein translocase protein TatA